MRSKWLTILALIMALVLLLACERQLPVPFVVPPATPKAEEVPKHGPYWQKAKAAQVTGGYREAVELWSREIQWVNGEINRVGIDSRTISIYTAHKKNAAIARANRGRCYQKLGDHKAAVWDYTLALNSGLGKSLEAGIYNNRGVAHGRMGEISKALGDYTKSIELMPVKNQAYYNRARIYQLLGRRYEALADVKQYILYFSSDPNGGKLLQEIMSEPPR